MLLKRYRTTGVLKAHLLINHFIILYNVFGEAQPRCYFLKSTRIFVPVVKTFVLYLGRLPDYPKTELHDIKVDPVCLEELQNL